MLSSRPISAEHHEEVAFSSAVMFPQLSRSRVHPQRSGRDRSCCIAANVVRVAVKAAQVLELLARVHNERTTDRPWRSTPPVRACCQQ